MKRVALLLLLVLAALLPWVSAGGSGGTGGGINPGPVTHPLGLQGPGGAAAAMRLQMVPGPTPDPRSVALLLHRLRNQ